MAPQAGQGSRKITAIQWQRITSAKRAEAMRPSVPRNRSRAIGPSSPPEGHCRPAASQQIQADQPPSATTARQASKARWSKNLPWLRQAQGTSAYTTSSSRNHAIGPARNPNHGIMRLSDQSGEIVWRPRFIRILSNDFLQDPRCPEDRQVEWHPEPDHPEPVDRGQRDVVRLVL